ncbi:MAG: hypothetical protein R2753_10500 [Chitinophagales bacterium]
MKTKYVFQAIIAALFIFQTTSCDDDTIEDMQPQEKSECIPYTPTAASGSKQDSWSAPNERDRLSDFIVIPPDLGGGYVKVKLTQNDPDLRPAMIIDTDFSGAAIISGSSAGTNNELIREAYFSVHPNSKYSIEVYPFFNADNYPVDYTIEWEFFSKVDCWESNDVINDAKKILIGETNEAYAIAGHIEDNVGALDENTYDWYKVELDTISKIKFEILDLPKDMRIVSRLFELNNPSAISTNFEFTGSDFGLDFNRGMTSIFTTTQELNPGTYYIEVHPDFLKDGRKANNDQSIIPEHFNKTYKFKVSLL